MGKDEKRLSISERIAAAAHGIEMVSGYRGTSPRVEIFSNQRVLIENHKGILEYGDTLMRINCGRVIVKITGQDLALKALSISELAIEGNILTVEYLT